MKQRITLIGLFFTLAMCNIHAQNALSGVFNNVNIYGDTLYYYLGGNCGGAVLCAPNALDSSDWGEYYGGMHYMYRSSNEFWEGYGLPSGNLFVPDSVLFNGQYYAVEGISASFYGTQLSSVSLPGSICDNQGHFFRSDTSILRLYWRGTIERWLHSGNIYGGCRHFLYMGDTLVTNLVIPEGDNELFFSEQSPFQNCVSLKQVTIPHSCWDIGMETFSGCTSLEEVIFLSDSMGGSWGQVFQGCTNLKHVQLPKCKTNEWGYPSYGLGDWCFKDCFSLTSITLPDSISLSAPNGVFINCPNLDTIYFGEHPPFISDYNGYVSNTFGGREDSILFIVPCGAIDQYQYVCKRNNGFSESDPYYECLEYWNFPNLITDYELYNIEVSSIDTSMGDAHHECFTAIANPKTGYYFTHWDDGDTNNPRIIPATPNRTITAYFTKQTYTIMATSDISSHGNVTGTGSYEYLDECTLEAIANDGYHFSHWNDGDSNAIRTFTVTQDSTMVAFFEINNYQLIAAPNDASLGNVTGSGTFAHGTHVTVTATPTQGNRFDRWSNNSIWANYIFTITKDTQLVAVFVPVDTVHVHDTTYIDVHDTTYIDVFVHDTTTVTDTVTLTEYVPVHDTTIVNTRDTIYLPVFLHDTTFVDVHDTTIVVDTLTLTEYVPVHDTTYIDVLVYDTITVIDTVTLTEYVPVHDTTYIDVFVHDTTTVIDTVTLTEYVPVHDTTYIDVFVHDTTYVDVFVHDTTTVTVIDTVDNYIFDTTIVHDTTLVTDTLWLTHYDTIWLHDTITIHDTIMVGMDDVDALNAKVYINSGQIVVDGTDGNTVWLYDAVGRLLATRQDDYAPLRFDVPATGTYLIKVGHHPARRVVVVK